MFQEVADEQFHERGTWGHGKIATILSAVELLPWTFSLTVSK